MSDRIEMRSSPVAVSDENPVENDNNVSIIKSNGHEHDDFFVKFVKAYYFPFLKKYCRYICAGWLAVFIICVAFGPKFLSNTRSDLDVPKGTPSAAAIDALDANYPTMSPWPPAFIVLHSNSDKGVIGPFSRKIDTDLTEYASSNSDSIDQKSGYYDFAKNPYLRFLESSSLSADNKTMVLTVTFKKSASLAMIQSQALSLLSFASKRTTSDVSVGCTGLQPLFAELSGATSNDIETIDGIVLPIAIIILGYNVRSYRHMLIAFCNLACTVLLAFAIMVPISDALAINPFSPSIMLSLGIAVCFDYNLFMLSRYREEMVVNKRSRDDAVLSCLNAAGHVVVLSGSTLFFTFMLLLAFPQNFLQSVGWGCGAMIFSAIVSNMSVTPALLLTFDCFSKFELFPTYESCRACFCCCSRSSQGTDDADAAGNKERDINGQASNASGDPLKMTTKSNGSAADIAGGGIANGSSSRGERKQMESDEEFGVSPGRVCQDDVVGNGTAVDSGGVITTAPDAVSSERAMTTWGQTERNSAMSSQRDKVDENVGDGTSTGNGRHIVTEKRTMWFYITYWVTKYSWLTLLVVAGITVPFAMHFMIMKVTSDNGLVYLQGSQSLKTLNLMSREFPIGQMNPYEIVLVTNTKNGVLTPSYFQSENTLIHRVLTDNAPHFITNSSITALSYFNEADVPYATAMGYLTPGTALYNSSLGFQYRVLVGGSMNTDRSASLVNIVTVVDPTSDAIIGFIDNIRATLNKYTTTPVVPGFPISMHLFGGYTSTYDVQTTLYGLVPVMVATTLVVVLVLVAINFGSVLISIRLFATGFIGLCWTYGLTAMTYQPGAPQRAFAVLTPNLKESVGTYWLIPIMAFSILVGLALDYDIFLMLRVLEFRKMGWSDRASVILAVEKTGNIITAAGLIMSISFAGLLAPQTIVLNQYGFILFIGVAIDTFLIRTIVVPAMFTVLGGSRTANAFFLSSITKNTRSQNGENKAHDSDRSDKHLAISDRSDAGLVGSTDAHPDHDSSAEVLRRRSEMVYSSRWDCRSTATNWWPTLMPEQILSDEEEEEAMAKGFSSPIDYLYVKYGVGSITTETA